MLIYSITTVPRTNSTPFHPNSAVLRASLTFPDGQRRDSLPSVHFNHECRLTSSPHTWQAKTCTQPEDAQSIPSLKRFKRYRQESFITFLSRQSVYQGDNYTAQRRNYDSIPTPNHKKGIPETKYQILTTFRFEPSSKTHI